MLYLTILGSCFHFLLSYDVSRYKNFFNYSSQIYCSLVADKPTVDRGAGIAQWIRLYLPSCLPPGFESQAHHLRFFHLLSILCYICHVKRTQINKKRPGLDIFLKEITLISCKKYSNKWLQADFTIVLYVGTYTATICTYGSKLSSLGGSPGLVVMGGDSRSKGRGFESWRRILDGHEIFHVDLLQKLYCLFEKDQK